MALTTGAPVRTPIHTRSITFATFARDDGLCDVEGTIEDRRLYDHKPLERDAFSAGAPYHSIRVTLTVDDSLRIVGAVGQMAATPFDECSAAPLPLQNLVGLTLGRGWRKALDEALDRSIACTHMREMLNVMPSAAIQAIPGYRKHMAGGRWPPELPATANPPHFVGGCVAWRQDGAVVLRHYPQFHRSPATGK